MNLCNIGEIKALLGRHDFHFSKAMGQNFLVAPWVPERIAEGSGADSTKGVLEIGPGIGCLTEQLARRAAKVTAVELDRRLLPVLGETMADYPNVSIVPGDILKTDIPALVAERFEGLTPIVCANLPYNITTPVLTALIDTKLFSSITVMIQREVARRITAPAGSADYGAFTVYANYHTVPQILFDVSPGCFIPQPKVTSSVLRLDLREAPAVDTDEALFFRVVRASFAQRRKTLLNGLGSAFGAKLGKEALTEAILSCGFDARVRGETLDLEGFARITEALKARLEA